MWRGNDLGINPNQSKKLRLPAHRVFVLILLLSTAVVVVILFLLRLLLILFLLSSSVLLLDFRLFVAWQAGEHGTCHGNAVETRLVIRSHFVLRKE